MDISIMTWNTRLYESGNEIGKEEIEQISEKDWETVIRIIKSHLEKPFSVAVLQEIPYKQNAPYKDRKKWDEHVLFTEIKKIFPEEDYTIIYNVSEEYQVKMTAVIAGKKEVPGENGMVKEDLIARAGHVAGSNLFVPFTIAGTDLKLLGVHPHNAAELQQYLSENNAYRPNVILGDFNAGNYIKKGEEKDGNFTANRRNYLLLTEGYIDLCQGQYTTTNCKYIDHVLLESSLDFLEEHEYKELEVNREATFSDHYPITFKLSCKSI
ncbi:MAG: hypothetical protein K2N94_02945 [Lachnospiraceae bacterium]|nr:hypothetical protein [Lachnospiraceae bacterium]